jgi:hypothetical protein
MQSMEAPDTSSVRSSPHGDARAWGGRSLLILLDFLLGSNCVAEIFCYLPRFALFHL